MQFYHYLIALILPLLLMLQGCGGLPFPVPGDRQALLNSCGIGQDACESRCKDNSGCVRACQAGFNGCETNIEEDRPTEWEPADAFYDGCTDVCDYDNCHSACSAGQSAIANDTADRLRKYGVTTSN